MPIIFNKKNSNQNILLMELISFTTKALIMGFFIYIYYNNNYSWIEKKHYNIIRKLAPESTLFLNKNNEFPIKKPKKVVLIGSGARNTIKGGLGSGDVDPHFITSCEEGLEKAGFTITTKKWLSEYIKIKENNLKEHMNYIKNLFIKNKVKNSFAMISFPEVEYDLEIEETAKNTDLAIYVLARNMGEGMDRRPIKGEVFLTNTEIKDILYLEKNYKKFMLVLNVGGVVDLSPVKSVSNILLLSQLGASTGDVLADIILGKANPSGKLATTWAVFNDYKFIHEFGNLDDTSYKEGVFVGYRYFDSVNIKPLYPFGFGKSYTEFNISKIYLSNIKEEISIKVEVKNIGIYPGKEVVQVYVSPSQENQEKPYQSLVAFNKTKNLKPSKKEEIILSFKLRDVARYDSKIASYILDKGKYIIRVGNSSRNTKIYGYIELDSDIITEKLKNINNEKMDFEDFKPVIKINDDLSGCEKIKLNEKDFELKTANYTYTYKIYDKVSSLSNIDLIRLCVGDYGAKEKEEFNDKQLGYGGITAKNVEDVPKYLNMADGPAGLRLSKIYGIDEKGIHRLIPDFLSFYNYNHLAKKKKISLVKNETLDINYSNYSKIGYQYPTAIPIATALAQSFNTKYVEQVAKVVEKEMEMFNVHIWLAPAMNIHRNILCGRNFEYFSEDPFVSGKMAAAITRSIQSYKNKGTTLKHFTGNNQEFNRVNSNSKISERALREIYLKGFRLAIEESHPYALMTSYNLLNLKHTSQDESLLIDVVRCEWKYEGLIMTDWSHSNRTYYFASKHPPQYALDIIKGGTNIIMPGSKVEVEELSQKLNENKLTRDDLLQCASKVYETIELLNK